MVFKYVPILVNEDVFFFLHIQCILVVSHILIFIRASYETERMIPLYTKL